ncbi:hypothetical protein GUJ93_ZPchr0013g34464 [Zizania palustris]|uniref:EF-hand domain-containing protein n=1 Tax=Zizania palustris TaxID=103762 RepID=A0A8J5X0V2_ZIZPA|nr:hypothetical protein GUJ93_ZPchr0013g34464 [Zizania palustris]
MAIIGRVNNNREPGPAHVSSITVEEFKKWLKTFDTNNDGRISRSELREAMRRQGCWFTTFRAGRAVRHADKNNDGFVDDSELENLVVFAQKNLGMKIYAA